jgi:hypothetical protein
VVELCFGHGIQTRRTVLSSWSGFADPNRVHAVGRLLLASRQACADCTIGRDGRRGVPCSPDYATR